MKLLSISIEKLFGQFDYNITLKQEAGITILTGPNGYGKTTILNIIWSLCTRRFDYIQNLPFKKIGLNLDDYQTIRVIKKVEALVMTTQNGNIITTHDGVKLVGYPPITKLYFELAVHDAVCETFEFPCVESGEDQAQVLKVLESIKVYLIKDQRLIYTATEKNDETLKLNETAIHNHTIELDSKELVMRIHQKQAEERKLDDALAPSLAKRFKEYKTVLPASEYQERFQKVSQKYKALQEYGIYQNDLESTAYEGDDKRFFSLNLEDWEKKIAVYDELLAKLNLFVSLLRSKWLVNKIVTVTADKGFFFTASGGDPLELSDLSSGEQHQTILLYELLFNAPPDSLVLIDEPETSMHVAWQIEFLQDIEKIANMSGLSFIIATHSPDLINDKMDLCIDLFDNAQGKEQHE